MLGKSWCFDERVQHEGYENTHTLIHNGCKKIIRSMKEISPLKQLEEKLTPSKLEELSNTPIKKQVEVTSKKETSSIMNLERNK